MNIFNKSVFIILLLILLPTTSFSQVTTSFSSDQQKFSEELVSFFSNSSFSNKQSASEIIEAFPAIWNSTKLNTLQKDQIINTANLFLKRKLNTSSHFLSYFNTLIALANANQNEKSISSWLQAIETVLKKDRINQLNTLLNSSDKILTQSTLYKSETTQWRFKNNNFSFDYDTTLKVILPETDLVCYAFRDSIFIQQTKGIYYPLSNLWLGQNGQVFWTRAGYVPTKVFAELSDYTILMNHSWYTAENVKFHNEIYLSNPIIGRLTDKILANVTKETATFPHFTSYDMQVPIKNIFDQISFIGGFAMKGSKILGLGNKEIDAKIFCTRNNNLFMVIASPALVIKPEQITAETASVTIYLENDSIYHPSVQLKYLHKEKEIILTQTEKESYFSPFFDSYHKVEIYCEALQWKLSDSTLEFKEAKGIDQKHHAAMFESANYFSDQRYNSLSAMDEANPLQIINRYATQNEAKNISIDQIAAAWGATPSQVTHILINLANKGIIIFDGAHNRITVTPKLIDFIQAKNKKTDYDVIQFSSISTEDYNAKLNVDSFYLKINGVKQIFLSDSQKVFIYPTNEEITLLKNRNFTFDGKIHAGLFDFYAKKCSFNYDQFKLDFSTIDSLTFFVRSKSKDASGNNPLQKVLSVIENLTGDLLIDKPNNKSSLKDYPEFPIFNSKTPSYVYFNKPSIQDSVYKNNSFYFHVNPFTLTCLDNFITDSLQFNGYLVSDSIFPTITEALKVQPDYSLGFIHQTPSQGYPVYGGKGTFTAAIDLSNKGLRGNGTLQYLTSNTYADNFYFYPDSMNVTAQLFSIKEQQVADVEYPSVVGDTVYQHWLPYADSMVISMKKLPITMYANESKLHGNLTIKPNGLTGQGMMAFSGAEMEANEYKFKKRVFDSDISTFKLKSTDLNEQLLAFLSFNYRAHVDFDKRFGKFRSNKGISRIEFPINKYICFMDELDWYLSQEEIGLKNNVTQQILDLNSMTLQELADVNITGTEFVSYHPQQDSLKFFSLQARYNLKTSIISAEEVKFMRVADAIIIPDSGKVIVGKNALMFPLTNAKILANTTTKYHVIHDAIVNISSKNKYTATGTYNYFDEDNTIQKIHLNHIYIDDTGHTSAEAHIPDSIKFMISPAFTFNGNIELHANNKQLLFDGHSSIFNDCKNNERSLFRFTSYIDPLNIYIPIMEKIKDVSNNALTASMLYSSNDNNIYPAFLSRKRTYNDNELLYVKGYLTFDKQSKEYRIAEIDKLQNLSLPGNYLSFCNNTCITYGEGQLHLNPDFDQLNIYSYGNMRYYANSDINQVNLMMILDFYFSNDALKILTESINNHSKLKAIDLTTEAYKKNLTEFVGSETADKILSDIRLYGALKRVPAKLNHTIVFNDLQMKWNQKTKSFLSFGSLGIGNIKRTQINKYVKGYIEIVRKRGADAFNIYFELDKEWYYFNYSRKLLQALSSNKEFNYKLIEMTKKSNRKKVKKIEGEEPFKFSISNDKKVKDFLKHVQVIDEEEQKNE